jgi:light-regulated signal transduction histidine kinase (bacteriophytochrome)
MTDADSPLDASGAPGALGNLDCAQEPIRIPGSIQPHGALMVIDAGSGRILQRSINAATILGDARAATAATLHEIPLLTDVISPAFDIWKIGSEPVFLRGVADGGRTLQIVGHRTRQGLILEFEEGLGAETHTLDALYPRIRGFLDAIEPIETIAALADAAAREIRDITGFDRVLIYRFEEDWSGVVIAEDGNGTLPSYLDLRFPASDIPAQARELYRLNRLRLIPDADFTPVPLEPPLCPGDGQPLDLSFAALRSVSPIHLEYMRNMETMSSMSISIVVEDELWGLISCHNRAPKRVSPQIRIACDFLGRIVALQLASKQRMADAAKLIVLKQTEARLLAGIAGEANFQAGLDAHHELWLGLAGATGAAMLVGGKLTTAGETPPIDALDRLIQWLDRHTIGDFFETDRLSQFLPEAGAYAGVASGLAAARISQLHASFILWFRPETVRTVKWGGDPYDKREDAAGGLHPRRSFAQWQELVRRRAMPWLKVEIQAMREFRTAIVNYVLRQAEERAELTEELRRSNRELEAFSYSVSHDLRAPFRHIVGYAELLHEREDALDKTSRHYLDVIIDSAMSAGRLVDDLLAFSQMGRTQLTKTRTDITKLVGEVLRTLEHDTKDRSIEWQIAPLPIAWGDAAMLRQVLQNLISNALKYTRGRAPAVISLTGEESADQTVYTVADNGVGFDMAYVGKLFGVFQRLHRVEEYEGTGIGLALCRRIVDRHGGTIEAHGALGEGARFRFALPKQGKERTIGRS